MSAFGFRTEQPAFLAVTADVVGSRELPDRAVFQRRLVATLASLNEEIGEVRVAAPLRITAGDEVQGLLVDPGAFVDVAVRLADELHPVQAVLGAGWGPLSTDPGPDVALLDGPCFHRARSALDDARRLGVWARVEGFGETTDGVLSALFQLMGAIRSRWTDKQAGYARGARRELQKTVARRAGVSPSVVSESLKAARFDAVRAGEAAARDLLTKFAYRPEVISDSAPGPNTNGDSG